MVPDVAVLVECLVRMQHAAEPSQSSRSLVTQSLGYIPYADRFQHRRSLPARQIGPFNIMASDIRLKRYTEDHQGENQNQ